MILAVGWSLIVVFLSVWPFPDTGGPEWTDKAVHFFMYAIASGLYYRVIKRTFRAVGYAFALGFLMELVQHFLPWRSFSPADMAANLVGAVAAALIVSAGSRRARSTSSS